MFVFSDPIEGSLADLLRAKCFANASNFIKLGTLARSHTLVEALRTVGLHRDDRYVSPSFPVHADQASRQESSSSDRENYRIRSDIFGELSLDLVHDS